MKKSFCIFTTLILVLTIAGCKKGENFEEDPLETDASTIQNTTLETQKEQIDDISLVAYEPTDAKIADGATVSIIKSKEKLSIDITEQEIDNMVREVLAYSGDFENLIKNGQTVVIKPNLVQMKVDSTGELLDKTVNGITTDWRVTNAVVKIIRELNHDGKVYIIEGSATGPTSEIMKYYNYTPEYMKGVDGFISLEEDCGAWQDFGAPEITKVTLENGLLHNEYYFNKILYEADVLISIPCLKTSSGVVVTAGIKNVSLGTPPGNIYGVSPNDPGKTNMVSHKIVDGELDKWIYDYYMCKPINYVIVDGLQGFQSGPVPYSRERTESDKMNMGIIIAGKDAVSVDTICALITGWDSQSVGYLNHFNENGVGVGDLSKIFIHGGYVDELRKYFTIKRPDLGGIQITDTEGPALNIKSFEVNKGVLNINLDAEAETVKVEAYVDDVFYLMSPWGSDSDLISLDVSSLKGAHSVKIVVYDRFLNRTQREFDIMCVDS